MLLPMHIPVVLCGLILGWKYGVVVGFVLPILRSSLFSMPVMFPGAVAMAFELATYGGLAGYLYNSAKWQCTKTLYISMLISMVAERVVWGIVQSILRGFGNFTMKMFIAGALLDAIPGIILQLILIPVLMVALKKAKAVPIVGFKEERINNK